MLQAKNVLYNPKHNLLTRKSLNAISCKKNYDYTASFKIPFIHDLIRPVYIIERMSNLIRMF